MEKESSLEERSTFRSRPVAQLVLFDTMHGSTEPATTANCYIFKIRLVHSIATFFFQMKGATWNKISVFSELRWFFSSSLVVQSKSNFPSIDETLRASTYRTFPSCNERISNDWTNWSLRDQIRLSTPKSYRIFIVGHESPFRKIYPPPLLPLLPFRPHKKWEKFEHCEGGKSLMEAHGGMKRKERLLSASSRSLELINDVFETEPTCVTRVFDSEGTWWLIIRHTEAYRTKVQHVYRSTRIRRLLGNTKVGPGHSAQWIDLLNPLIEKKDEY